MHHSKLIKLLSALSQEEFKKLGRYLQSPYCNSNKKVSHLYTYLDKYFPDFDGPALRKERVFAKLFKDETFNAKKLGNLMSECSLKVEEFIIDIELKKDELLTKRLLVKGMGKRKLYEYFDRSTHKLIARNEEASIKDQRLFRDLMDLNAEWYFHPATLKYAESGKRMVKAMEYLDHFFCLTKMKWGLELLERQQTSSEQNEVWLLNQVIEKSSAADLQEMPVFNLYVNLLKFTRSQSPETYFQLKAVFLDSMDQLTKDDQQTVLIKLLNFSAKQVTAHGQQYVREYFELNKLGLEHHLLTEDDQLSDTAFTNLVITAAKLGEFAWAESFIEEYSPLLAAKVRTIAIDIGLAYLHFYKKNYQETIHFLKTYDPLVLAYKLRARTLSIRAHFEIFLQDATYYELIDLETKAFEKFIRRKQMLTEYRQKAYLKFIGLIRQLTLLIQDPNPNLKRRESIEEDLSNNDFIVAKEWLVEKLNEIKA